MGASQTTLPRCFGRYVLLEKLAAGGMGEIFAAVPRGRWGLTGFLALKKLLPALSQDAEFLSRFRDEARLVIPMRHPNVVKVYEVGRVDDEYFIAMELVDGRNLGQILNACWARRQPELISIPAALYIIKELLAGLSYCHNATDPSGARLGVVHRDVSPANVLLSYDGQVKLADFGLASSAQKVAQTKPNMLLGHLGYFPPEALEGQKQDQRADLYSTGVLLYEILTCTRFAPSADPIAVRDQLRSKNRVRVSDYRRGVPPQVDEIVARAVAPDMKDRFQTAEEFLQATQRALLSLDALFGAQQLSELLMHALFDPYRKMRQLKALLHSVDLEELDARYPIGRTVCIGEAIPVYADESRAAFGCDMAVLTMTDEPFEGQTQPLPAAPPERRARARERTPAPARSAGAPFRPASAVQRMPHRTRARWITPGATMITAGKPRSAQSTSLVLRSGLREAKTKP